VAGDSFAERTYLCHQYSLSPVESFIGGVVDTAKKLFTGVNDTTNKFFSGVSYTGD
jgi:hypothetical protein